ncbi:MAG: SPASM domain-containing protein [Muribaculaceae bacterium]|nr:SPASM domain-containing protein [Muribaculaceae bacterium]
MKKSIYQFYEEIDGVFLHYTSFTNRFLILNRCNHDLFEECSNDALTSLPEKLFNNLKENGFIVEDDVNEYECVINGKKREIFNTELYNIVINTTLLLCFSGIKEILEYSKIFCKSREIDLVVDFTTNATMLSDDIVDYLKQFRCHFQITLDGAEERHNKIKVDKSKGINTYKATIRALRAITDRIQNHWIGLRVNFDNNSLKDIQRILNDVDFLDRSKSFIILKKVWQLKSNAVNHDALLEAIQMTLDRGFLVDYYVMPKGSVCFAEREAQALFNYDGKVFKCTTICSFDKSNQLGELDFMTGEISWKSEVNKNWYRNMLPVKCKECRWLPVCLGPCTHQLMNHKGINMCTFDACSLTQREYLMYLFKFNVLSAEINGENM